MKRKLCWVSNNLKHKGADGNQTNDPSTERKKETKHKFARKHASANRKATNFTMPDAGSNSAVIVNAPTASAMSNVHPQVGKWSPFLIANWSLTAASRNIATL